MSVDSVRSGSSVDYTMSSVALDANRVTMTAEDVLIYVRMQLDSIDAQLNDFKGEIEQRKQRTEDLREAQAILRKYTQGNGSVKNIPPEDYNRLMTLLGRNTSDPKVYDVYTQLLESYGGFVAQEEFTLPNGKVVEKGAEVKASGKFANKHLSGKEAEGMKETLRSAQEGVNSNNEMLMLDVQKLVQQRNQASQFASNMLHFDHEDKMGIIGNIR